MRDLISTAIFTSTRSHVASCTTGNETFELENLRCCNQCIDEFICTWSVCCSSYVSLLLHYELFLHTWPLQSHHPSSVPPYWPKTIPSRRSVLSSSQGTALVSETTTPTSIEETKSRTSGTGQVGLGITWVSQRFWSLEVLLPKFNSKSPLKSYRNPIGKDRLPTTIYQRLC